MRETPANKGVDMSPKAIEQRLRDVAELYQLGMALRRARFLGKTVELRKNRRPDGQPMVDDAGPEH